MQVLLPVSALPPAEWNLSIGLTPYEEAIAAMEARVAAIREASAPERVWLVEHPPLYTAGSSAKDGDLVQTGLFPVYSTGRGGQYTYHGPGQRVVYLMLDLTRMFAPRVPDLHEFVSRLERWIIAALADLGVAAVQREGRIGVWIVGADGREDKIAAIGIRVRKGVSYHGVAINVAPDLSHYRGIIPCGIREHGVTSLKALGYDFSMEELDTSLYRHFQSHFGLSLQSTS